MRGCSLPRAFQKRVKFLYIRRIFIEEFERLVREASGNVKLSPRRPLLGNMEGVSLMEILRDQWRAPDMEHLQLNQFGLLFFWIQFMLGAKSGGNLELL